jgi:hypothetical protein
VQCLGVDTLHVAGRVYVSGQGREHDHAENRGNEHADAERPQQFGAENSPLVRFCRLIRHGLAHRAAREEDQQIDRQVTDHQKGNGGSRQDSGPEGHDAHDPSERRFIDFVGDLGGSVSGGSLLGTDHRIAPTRAPANICDVEFYTGAVKRPAASRKSMNAPLQ